MEKTSKWNTFRISTASAMLVLMAIAIFAAAGCSKPYPSDPMEVIFNFTMDIINQDFDGAKRYCTQDFIDKEFNAVKSMMKKMTEMPKASKFQSSQEGDIVKIWVKGQEFRKTVLIQEKGKWKIDRVEVEPEFTDEDAINMMKGLGKGLEGLGSALGK